MQIYLLGLFLLILVGVQIAIVRAVIGRRRAGEPWLALGPEGARREPVYRTAPKPAPVRAESTADAQASQSAPAPAMPANTSRAAFTAGGPGKTPARSVTKQPPRPKAAPEGAVPADVEARLEWAFDLLQTGKIPLESYRRIVESERDQVKVKIARLREEGADTADERDQLEASLDIFGWCLDWAEARAREAA